MTPTERPLTDVLKSILGNVQDIVGSEVKLVKAEVHEQVLRTTHAAGWIAVGTAGALFAVGFALLAAFFGLCLVVPEWQAAAIMALALALIAASTLLVARRRRGQYLIRPRA